MKRNGKIGIFSKKCRCKYCGYIMKTTKSHNDRYLRCPTRQVDKRCCEGSFISENVLKKTILNELNLLIKQYLNKNELEESIILNKFRNQKEQLQKEITQYQSSINKYVKALKNLYMDKVNEIISEEEFVMLSAELKKEKANTEDIIKERV